jgi:hypothetical protein
MPGDTPNCTSCGPQFSNPNPLDPCGRDLLQCDNPCRKHPGNTAACESLPSQISNFTLQFFGEVVKTEVNNQVQWTLPCSLDVGLSSNPRGAQEPLGCYFLRLFQNGVTGRKGPPGDTGPNGCNGANSYSVTLQQFSQPTEAVPYITVAVQYVPTIFEGAYVFIAGSGTYFVVGVTANSPYLLLNLTLIYPVSNPGPVVPVGSLVIPSGVPGAAVKGPQGDQGVVGDQGIQGPAGPVGPQGGTALQTNGYYTGVGGTNWTLPNAYAPADFLLGGAPSILLTSPGTYLFIINTSISDAPGGPNADSYSVKLVDVTAAADIVGTTRTVTGFEGTSSTHPFSLAVLITMSDPNHTVALYGKNNSGTVGVLIAGATSITWMKVA